MGVPKAWLSELKALVSSTGSDDHHVLHQETIGILAFEAAATMARLVSLYKALSEAEILRLRSDTMRSQGVAYLNSTNQPFLLRLACAELMTELDRTAVVISRFDKKHHGLTQVKRFIRVYSDLKAGISSDLEQSWFSKKRAEKKVRKMEKFITATSKLCTEMEVLEVSRQKLNKQCNRYSGPMPVSKLVSNATNDLLADIKAQDQKIHKLKEESLWSKTFNKVIGIMAPLAFFIFARICSVFGPFVPGLPAVVTLDGKNTSISFAPVSKLRFPSRLSSSGPMEKQAVNSKEVPIRNSCPIFGSKDQTEPHGNWEKLLEAPSKTVGGSCMALRYADVIVSAEKLLLMKSNSNESKGESVVRDEIYEMLPLRLREAVRRKLRECWRDPGPLDGSLADGWKEAVERIMRWLSPVAHDTLRWQAERNMDRRHCFDPKPKALLLQTLHFSDMDKTEAAIVEVLVGLSCVCWFEERCHESLRL
ncbi:hypothetical protein IHE45_12G091400 [Dioscorea alata]|uniref:Uncharacterized protein n=1 Tax=Dioscorea alata TaxID=55571 RepID=A0ACB7V406_DIOAL|nr:hypothetical protein IHE45_12G091400 [Dioscorea alata]